MPAIGDQRVALAICENRITITFSHFLLTRLAFTTIIVRILTINIIYTENKLKSNAASVFQSQLKCCCRCRVVTARVNVSKYEYIVEII